MLPLSLERAKRRSGLGALPPGVGIPSVQVNPTQLSVSGVKTLSRNTLRFDVGEVERFVTATSRRLFASLP